MSAGTTAPRVGDLGTGLAALDRLAVQRGIRLAIDAPLAPVTTLRVGGPADRLVEPRTAAELLAALELARQSGVPWLLIGNGSNLVVADAGVRGLVIRNRARGLEISDDRLAADAGAPMALLVKRSAVAGLAGLEWAIAVPGTLGGAVWANAGAHGGQMADSVLKLDVWDPADGEQERWSATDCRFAYRESRFKHEPWVVLSATLQLAVAAPAAVAARVAAFQAQRQATQPLAEQNAGSVFRNPPRDHAGRLIEAAGLKGMTEGTATVSQRHANFIVTRPPARAADVRRLADRVRASVLTHSGVALEYEIAFVGDWGPAA